MSPNWYDKSKLCRIRFALDETGWAINMGDGTYRLANTPIVGMVGKQHPDLPQWGDLVKIVPHDGLKIIEKYEHV